MTDPLLSDSIDFKKKILLFHISKKIKKNNVIEKNENFSKKNTQYFLHFKKIEEERYEKRIYMNIQQVLFISSLYSLNFL